MLSSYWMSESAMATKIDCVAIESLSGMSPYLCTKKSWNTKWSVLNQRINLLFVTS